VPANGDSVAEGAGGSATTSQLTWVTATSQPIPVQLLRASNKFVPTTAAKLGTVVDQAVQAPPLLVEYLYSTVHVPVPPEEDTAAVRF
jgi:hypothetical protein